MEYFRQLWNGVWHMEPASDPTIQWMIDVGIAEPIVLAIVTIPTLIGFVVYCQHLNWIYWEKPRREFERKMQKFEETGGTDFSIFDE